MEEEQITKLEKLLDKYVRGGIVWDKEIEATSTKLLQQAIDEVESKSVLLETTPKELSMLVLAIALLEEKTISKAIYLLIRNRVKQGKLFEDELDSKLNIKGGVREDGV